MSKNRKRRRRNPALCPCGRAERYAACSGRFIHGEATPVTCAELMRSRYAAYANGEVDYIL